MTVLAAWPILAGLPPLVRIDIPQGGAALALPAIAAGVLLLPDR
jgi:hypothetical protein